MVKKKKAPRSNSLLYPRYVTMYSRHRHVTPPALYEAKKTEGRVSFINWYKTCFTKIREVA